MKKVRQPRWSAVDLKNGKKQRSSCVNSLNNTRNLMGGTKSKILEEVRWIRLVREKLKKNEK